MDEPKKYIRTLAGDMKIVEEGGTPDLKPLEESAETPQVTKTEPEASFAPPGPAPAFRPAPLQAQPKQKEAPVEEPLIVAEVPPELKPESMPEPELAKPSPLETYTSDFTDRMKTTGATTATVLAAEADAGEQVSAETEEPAPKKNILYISIGILLLIIGGGAIYYAYARYTAAPVPVVVPTVQAPIFVDDRQEVSGSGTRLLQAIEQSMSSTLAPHSVHFLYQASSTESIFTQLPLSQPGILKRNVNKDGSMAGIVSSGTAQSAFFILSVTSYRDTFAAMLSWEDTMPYNLSALYPAYPVPMVATTTTIASTTVATSTPKKKIIITKIQVATTTPAAPNTTPGFRDEVVSNHDVRVYRDAFGRAVFLYGYWNQTTLVIARDATVFTELLGRLATSHTP